MTVGRSGYGLDLILFTKNRRGLRRCPDNSIEGATVETEVREVASAPAARSPCRQSAATPTPNGACRADRSSPPFESATVGRPALAHFQYAPSIRLAAQSDSPLRRAVACTRP